MLESINQSNGAPKTMALDNLMAWRAFIAVARSGSFSTAAEQLDRDKSTISRAVASLEKALGKTTRDRWN